MQPYSIDFRKKIIEIRHQKGISIRKLAQRFRVAKSFIQKLFKQYEETGNLESQPQGGSLLLRYLMNSRIAINH